MHSNDLFQRTQKAAAKKADELGCSCLIQSGSSLRQEDFTPGSDLDLLAIFDEEVEDKWSHDHYGSIEISILKDSKDDFLQGLKNGHPFELMALKFGKVSKDDGFLQDLDTSRYSPTERTIEVWIRSGLNQYSKMLNSKYSPSDFYDAAYHSFRSFSRTILLEKEGVLLESDRDIMHSLEDLDKKAADYFSSLREDRFKVPGPGDDRSEDIERQKNHETLKKVDYIGEKAMYERGKIFPSYKRLKGLLGEIDFKEFRIYPRDRERINLSVFGEEGWSTFEFYMGDGELRILKN